MFYTRTRTQTATITYYAGGVFVTVRAARAVGSDTWTTADGWTVRDSVVAEMEV